MPKTRYADIKSFISKDGSVIRELMHPAAHGNVNQSFAEAIVTLGKGTRLHQDHPSEEIYHVPSGEGPMVCGDEVFIIHKGDTICIPPGTPHRVDNTGKTELRILWRCSPPYF